eukprot:SAG31_NODE_18217_length_643_cov_1.044118_1_plen_89_part_00
MSVTPVNHRHWNGLIRDFYKPRVQCYVDQVSLDLGAEARDLNMDNITRCAVLKEMDFTQSSQEYSVVPTTDKTLALSRSLIAKYSKYL